MEKVKREDDETKLKKEAVSSNADVEQLEEIERKEEEEMNRAQGDDEILESLEKRAAGSLSSCQVNDFIYDKEKYRWCKIVFEMPMKFKSIDMTNPLREAAKNTVIWEVPKIKRAFTHKQNDVLVVTTDGINIAVG